MPNTLQCIRKPPQPKIFCLKISSTDHVKLEIQNCFWCLSKLGVFLSGIDLLFVLLNKQWVEHFRIPRNTHYFKDFLKLLFPFFKVHNYILDTSGLSHILLPLLLLVKLLFFYLLFFLLFWDPYPLRFWTHRISLTTSKTGSRGHVHCFTFPLPKYNFWALVRCLLVFWWKLLPAILFYNFFSIFAGLWQDVHRC